MEALRTDGCKHQICYVQTHLLIAEQERRRAFNFMDVVVLVSSDLSNVIRPFERSSSDNLPNNFQRKLVFAL